MKKELSTLIEVMDLLRKRLHKDIPLQQIALLFAVAENPGITMPELMKVLNMPQGSISRNVKALSGYVGRQEGEVVSRGYDMLRTAPDPNHPRVRACFLTERGEGLIRDLGLVLRTGRVGKTLAGPSAQSDFQLPHVRDCVCKERIADTAMRLIQVGFAAN